MLVSPAGAAVVISTAPTTNIACSGGDCVPTAPEAVLNVQDLQTLLAAGDVVVTTKGSAVEARSIAIKAYLTWSTPSRLTLQAGHAIFVQRLVHVSGQGGLS